MADYQMPQDSQQSMAQQPTEENNTTTVSITRDTQGNYTVEKETPLEEQSETGGEGTEQELSAGATKAKNLNDAMRIAKSMFEELDGASAEDAFLQGYQGEDSAQQTISKQQALLNDKAKALIS